MIFPIKSLDGVEVEETTLQPSGALLHDRRFALVDEQGFVNGKRTADVHRLRTHVDLAADTIAVKIRDAAAELGGAFRFDADRQALTAWLRSYFHLDDSLRLVENVASGFPDDTLAPGPTIVSTATLECVAGWFPGLSLDELRRRFRANLEIEGVEPFWEDRLSAEADRVVRFRLGDAVLEGVNPCQRCVVPTRDSLTGEVDSQFARHFAARREACLPDWAARSRFDHFYRLAVNTRPASDARSTQIRVGASLRILGTFAKEC